MSEVFRTERISIRELNVEDFDNLYEILSDPETMAHYPNPWSQQKTKDWIDWNIESYKQNRFGMWALYCLESGKFIGECGITLQDIEGEPLPEIGYHVHKSRWGRGYATEAAKECLEYGFNNLGLDIIYTYAKSTNKASLKVAEKNGMKYIKTFKKEVMGTLVDDETLFGITKSEYLSSK